MSQRVDLPEELIRWIESVEDARVASAVRHEAGASRSAWQVDVSQGTRTKPLFLLRDRGGSDGSQRDAAVLRALAPTVIPVPAVRAASRELGCLLLERVAGRSDFPAVDQDWEREPTARHLMQLAAALHQLDASSLGIPHLDRPTSPSALAQEQLAPIQQGVARLGESADPLFAFALGWLRRHAPTADLRWALVHSDLGPGNFLYAGGEVKAIVDWEVAHLGDPMEDLAALSIRDMATPIGDLSRRFREYQESGGIRVDLDRVRYYRALLLTRNSLLISLRLADRPSEYDVRQMTMYATLLMRGAALALCDALGVDRPRWPGTDRIALEDELAELATLVGRGMTHRVDGDAALRELVTDARDGDRDQELAPHLARRMFRLAQERREWMGPLFDRLPQPLEDR